MARRKRNTEKEPYAKFMDELAAMGFEDYPWEERWPALIYKWENGCGAIVGLRRLRANEAYLGTIKISGVDACLRAGYGSMAMEAITEAADTHKVGLKLVARPFGTMAMPAAKLQKWYARFGFKMADLGGGLMSDEAMERARRKNPSKRELRNPWPDPEKLARLEELEPLMGEVSDRELGEAFGFTAGQIREGRRRRGIESHQERERRTSPISGSTWTAAEVALLGTMKDSAVAERTGRHTVTVCRWRKELGIPPFKPAIPPGAHDWTEEIIADLGTATDREIGEKYGISNVTISVKRKKLGIPSFQAQRKAQREKEKRERQKRLRGAQTLEAAQAEEILRQQSFRHLQGGSVVHHRDPEMGKGGPSYRSRHKQRKNPTHAENAALSLLDSMEVDEAVRAVRKHRGKLYDPVSRSLVTKKDVLAALDGFRLQPVAGEITVYHATSPSAAQTLLKRGFRQALKPRRRAGFDYAPGRGADQGLYVGASPAHVEGYGTTLLEVSVPTSFLSVPTEMAQLGYSDPMEVLAEHDGAVVNFDLPASSFKKIRKSRRNPSFKVGDRVREGKRIGKVVAFHSKGTVDVKFDDMDYAIRRQIGKVKRANPRRRTNGRVKLSGGGKIEGIEAFLNTYERFSHPDPWHGKPKGRWWRFRRAIAFKGWDKGCFVWLTLKRWQGWLWIDTISTDPEECFQKGYATEVMNFLTDLADTHGIALALHPEPYMTVGIRTSDRLAEWYAKFGFKDIPGGAMMRKPRKANPDPLKAQFDAQVQGIYESQVREQLGLPYNAPFTDKKGRRIDRRLSQKVRRELLSGAFAIATSVGRRHGYLVSSPDRYIPFPVIPTAKGLRRSAERMADKKEHRADVARFEKSLALARKRKKK